MAQLTGGAVSSMALDGGLGGGPVTTLHSPGAPNFVVVDPPGGRMYWTHESGGVQSASVQAGGPITTLYSGNTPAGLAVDLAGQRVYWAEYNGARIRSAPLNGGAGGGTATTLYTGQTLATGVALDVANRRMLWTADSEIRSAPMDGGTVTTLHGASTTALRGVALLRAPAAVTPPAVGGTPGRALACDGAAWGADMPEAQFFRSPQTIGYRWFQDGDEIAGATASTYTAPRAGRYSCTATATNGAGSTAQTSAAATVDPRVTVVKTLSPSTDAGRFDLLVNGVAVRARRRRRRQRQRPRAVRLVRDRRRGRRSRRQPRRLRLGDRLRRRPAQRHVAGARSGHPRHDLHDRQHAQARPRDRASRPAARPAAPGPPPPGPPAAPRPTCEGRVATIVAAPGQTRIAGTPGADVIIATGAADTIDARGGADTICAGRGADAIRGGSGNDVIRGGAGDDDLRGDAGDDLLLGGAGKDDLRGAGGDDRLGGGDGDDRVDGGAGADLLDEQRLGGRGNDRLLGASGDDRVRTAGATKDTVDCGPGDDFALMDSRDKQRRCDTVRRVGARGR